MKIITTNLEKVMQQAVEAWLNGDSAFLSAIKNRAEMAAARRKLLKVMDREDPTQPPSSQED